ncbi:hypothetical protein SARC_10895 [Sphaeroforma arctica JP610]|uniref:Uncharacterized protein n=1 Tax=Sphaeroforma arctica JP610 TaxID=667725 RepID=A0A0L0FIL1_9EUKA|nr:hypothetical protein SARC_10895 [Sphaeroforma arctica JP610]KNC76612.1 hypothetical protein SARC_10895 [Sphaeroforma arctica JP610]|eukprot:XP_014150514.1 hypothetical protein SARC_10895 [Sphaeroforma arctica JP610]
MQLKGLRWYPRNSRSTSCPHQIISTHTTRSTRARISRYVPMCFRKNGTVTVEMRSMSSATSHSTLNKMSLSTTDQGLYSVAIGRESGKGAVAIGDTAG